MATLTWKSNNGNLCVLTISNGANTALTPSASPFSTSGDGGDDLFEPIRTQSGNIGIIGGSNDIESLIGDNPLERQVTLKVNNEVRWVGFLQSTTYSQDWTAGPNSIKIPVVSPLALTEGIKLSSNNLNYQSFAMFLWEMNEALSSSFDTFIFPSHNNVEETLGYKFDRMNFATLDEDTGTYEMATYHDVLENICKLFGWTCYEDGTTLVFSSLDVDQSSSLLTDQDLYLADDGSGQSLSANSQVISQSTIESKIKGRNHTIDYMPGKKSVSVIGCVNPYDETMYELDIDTLGNSNNNQQCDRAYAGAWQQYYSRCYSGDSHITIKNPGSNIKYDAFAKSTKTTSVAGSSIVREYLYSENNDYDDSTWEDRIIIGGNGSNATVVVNVPVPITRNAMTEGRFIVLCGKIKSASYGCDVFGSESGAFLVKAECGQEYFNGVNIQHPVDAEWQQDSNSYCIVGPKTKYNAFGARYLEENNGFLYMPYPNTSGNLKLTFYTQATNNLIFCIEDFKVKFTRSWAKFGRRDDMNEENKNTHEIGNGFQDDYEVTSSFTCQRGQQYGTGIILSNNLNSVVTTLSNSGGYPEYEFAQRLKTYYSKTRRKITAVLNNEYYDPEDVYQVDGSHNYRIASQDIDWYKDENTVTFIEL